MVVECCRRNRPGAAGTQVTCFTSTKVQILTLKALHLGADLLVQKYKY
jgi:hypothetical protein